LSEKGRHRLKKSLHDSARTVVCPSKELAKKTGLDTSLYEPDNELKRYLEACIKTGCQKRQLIGSDI
jgi:hypothetical protein